MSHAVGYSLPLSAREDLPRALDEAAAHRADSVELPVFGWDLVVGGRLLEARVEALAEDLVDRPFGYSVHGVLGVNFMDAADRLYLHDRVARANIEIAARLGARHLVLHAGLCPDDGAPAISERYARQRDRLARLGDVAGARGVVICVENVFSLGGLHTATPARLAEELDRLDHPAVRATFDISHGALQSAIAGADFLEEATALAPFARHLHVHDSFALPFDFWTMHPSEQMAFGIGDLHMPLGWGDLPFDRLARTCAFPKDALFNIELNPRHWSELAETLAATRAFATLASRAAHES